MRKPNSLQKIFSVELLRDKCSIEANSRIYGVILYTSSHPFVVKTLEDPAFWNALNEISGPNWPIFSVKPKSKRFPAYHRQLPLGTLEMIVPPICVNSDENAKYLNYFGITDTNMLPCFVVFIWDDNDQLKTIACKIASKPESEVYNSLEEIAKIISKIEAQVPEEEKTTEVVFQKVERALKLKEKDVPQNKLKNEGCEIIDRWNNVAAFNYSKKKNANDYILWNFTDIKNSIDAINDNFIFFDKKTILQDLTALVLFLYVMLFKCMDGGVKQASRRPIRLLWCSISELLTTQIILINIFILNLLLLGKDSIRHLIYTK
jgi:hypothetical protein